MESKQPPRFEQLQILAVLDETHHGTVTVQLVRHHQAILVCKSILKSSLDDPVKLQHIYNEKEALLHFTKLNNPHINRLLSTSKDDNHLRFYLEPVEGVPLHKLLKMVGRFPQRFVAMVAVQVAWILEQFHSEGYVYRDVKLSNFIVDRHGRISMIDLGKAKRIGKERTSTICGTLHAIPPEVLFGGGSYSYAYELDYYEFGVLLFELLVGSPPFGYEGANPKIRQEIARGLNEQKLKPISNPSAASLIKQLMYPPPTRLGGKGGWKDILSHEYFRQLPTAELKTIYEGKASQQLLDSWQFEPIRQEIDDFGLDLSRYEVQQDDPFANF